VIRFLRNHPTWGGAALSILGAVLGVFLKNPEMVAALVAVAAAFLGVHSQVTPTHKAREVAGVAASQAANKVAAQLDGAAAGPVGTVTAVGGKVVGEVLVGVRDIVGSLLR
jgi:hypothetical protein